MHLQRLIDNIGTPQRFHDAVYLENFVNNGSPSGSDKIHRLTEAFRPGKILGFPVPVDPIQSTEAEIFCASPSENIINVVEGTRGVVQFLIHPEEYKRGKYLSKGCVHGYPTASGRTLMFYNGGNPYYAKLHYSGMLGRIGREMTKKRVKGAGNISRELDDIISDGLLDEVFSFLPESYGIITRKYSGNEVGMTYREFDPRGSNQAPKRISIPFFSLFSRDHMSPEDNLLLIQILQEQTHPKEYFINSIIGTLLRAFKTILLDGGLLPENHGQNISLQIDTNLRVTSIIHRDLYEFYVDIQMRESRGLSTDNFQKILDRNIDPEIYYQMKSYMFDFKLGEYVLYPLVVEFCRAFGYPEDMIIHEISELFESLSSEWKEIFYPYGTFYRFDNVEKTYVNGRPDFKEGGKPRFRKS